MRFALPSRISGCVRQVLAAAAVLAILGLSTPSASASIALSYNIGSGALTGTGTDTLNIPATQLGDFNVSLQSNTSNSPTLSTLTTTTITLHNMGTTTETIDIVVTGQNFSAGSLTGAGTAMLMNYSLGGTTTTFNSTTDTTTGNSWVDNTNAGLMTSSPGAMTEKPVGTLSGTYGPANSPTIPFTRAGLFSLTQMLAITLGAGDNASLTISTASAPSPLQTVTPEPSSMVLAGIGALGMIGYGLRRRKVLGA